MSQSPPRYEFRVFARNLKAIEERLRSIRTPETAAEHTEIYLIPNTHNDLNVKIRDATLDVKLLLTVHQGLEQWQPRLKRPFPLERDFIRQELFPGLRLHPPWLTEHSYDLDDFLERIVRPHPALCAATVFKRRLRFTMEHCLGEFAEVWINGAGLHTVALESESPERLLEVRAALQLEGLENVSYPLGIRRSLAGAPLNQGSLHET